MPQAPLICLFLCLGIVLHVLFQSFRSNIYLIGHLGQWLFLDSCKMVVEFVVLDPFTYRYFFFVMSEHEEHNNNKNGE